MAFRITGKQPELWDAVTGETKPVDFYQEKGRTFIDLFFNPNGSIFVVFSPEASVAASATGEATINKIKHREQLTKVQTLNSSWQVEFDPNGVEKQLKSTHLLAGQITQKMG